MTKYLAVFALAASILGCSQEAEVKTNPPTPPPTEADLAKMPPQAAAHAKEMDAYAKAMAEQNKRGK